MTRMEGMWMDERAWRLGAGIGGGGVQWERL